MPLSLGLDEGRASLNPTSCGATKRGTPVWSKLIAQIAPGALGLSIQAESNPITTNPVRAARCTLDRLTDVFINVLSA